MPLTPEEVRNKQFTTVRLREGYDEDEVDAFLDEMETEFSRLLKENEELRAQLAVAEQAAAEATSRAAQPATPQPTAVVVPPSRPSVPPQQAPAGPV
ncbi:MAG: DivIVA domain-containing protein, partial [Actinomycetes bacterium]